jgi:hypothetical protein
MRRTIGALVAVGALAVPAWVGASFGSTAGARASAPSRVLLEQSGEGSTVSEIFPAPRTWDLKWSFDCSTSPRDEGIFSVQQYLLGANAQQDVPNIDAPRLNLDGPRGSGVTHYDARAGTSYLWIVSQCDWSVRVVSRPGR